MLGGNITLQVYESTDKEIWSVFREHHYLTAEFNKGAKLYTCYWNDTLVAMFSVLNQPSGSYKYAYRVHRAVTLPDFQGLGIGTKLFDFFGEKYIHNGDKLFLRSSHVRLANHCRGHIGWIEGGSSQKISNAGGASHEKKYRNYDRKRMPYSFEYVGSDYNTKEHQPILCLGEADEAFVNQCFDKIIEDGKCPIIVTGIADLSVINNWEKVAKERGIRTELLFIKAKGKFSIVKKYLEQSFDAIIIGKENQDLIAQYRKAKDIRQLITYNYKKDTPIYYEKLITS